MKHYTRSISYCTERDCLFSSIQKLMRTPQWDTADNLCVLASCGRQHMGEHQSSAAARRIVWTQAHGALVRGVEGGCILSPLQPRPTVQQLNTSLCLGRRVWTSELCVCVGFVCDCRAKRKGGKGRWEVEKYFVPVCICVYLAGSLVEGGWRICKEEVRYSQDSCWYLVETEEDKTEWRQWEKSRLPHVFSMLNGHWLRKDVQYCSPG